MRRKSLFLKKKKKQKECKNGMLMCSLNEGAQHEEYVSSAFSWFVPNWKLNRKWALSLLNQTGQDNATAWVLNTVWDNLSIHHVTMLSRNEKKSFIIIFFFLH